MATSYKLLGNGNYIDASGVAYNHVPLDDYLDNLQIATYAKRYDETYTTISVNQTNIPISLSVFNESTPLFIGVNGLMLSEGIDYTINYSTKRITLNKPIEIVGTKIQIVVLKQVSGTEQTFELLKGEKGEPGDGLPKIASNEIRVWNLEPGIYELTGDTPILYYNGATGAETETRLIKGSILTVYYQAATNFADHAPTKSWYSWFNGALGHGAEHILYGCTSETEGGVSIVNLAQAAKSPETTVNEFGIYYWDGRAGTSSDFSVNRLWQKIIDDSRNKGVFVIAPAAESYGRATIYYIPQNYFNTNTTEIYIHGTTDTVNSSNSASLGVGLTPVLSIAKLVLSNLSFVSIDAAYAGTTSLSNYRFLPTSGDLVTGYTPTNDYHPATKKYADEVLQDTNNLLKIGTEQTIYSNYFTYAGVGNYGFDYNSSTGEFISNNIGQDSTVAETNVTITSNIPSGDLVIYYDVGSESGYDKFTLTVSGKIIVSNVSGTVKGSYICPELTNGTIINLKYSKDTSQGSNGDRVIVKLQRTSQLANNAVVPGNFVTKGQLDSAIGQINEVLATLTTL